MSSFEFTISNFKFKIHHLEEGQEENAKKEARMIVDDYLQIDNPYPPRKEFVFKDLQELLKFRG
jgi:hypothetical protein